MRDPGASSPFQLRGNSFTMMVLKLSDPASDAFFPQLANKVRQAPNFFRNAPIVLDLDDLSPDKGDIDFVALTRRLRECDLIPIAVQGGDRRRQDAAMAAGLPLAPSGRAVRAAEPAAPDGARRDAAGVSAADSGTPDPGVLERATMVITEPVRSGRQVYAPGGDLVVTAPVSSGAELLADGHIHVYGPLRGRALAGLSGDASARIFCLSLEAEIVSIAGLYRVNEDLDPPVYRKPAQVYLKNGFLYMEAF